jgi:hypothetical protein
MLKKQFEPDIKKRIIGQNNTMKNLVVCIVKPVKPWKM